MEMRMEWLHDLPLMLIIFAAGIEVGCWRARRALTPPKDDVDES
jgi:hypothetical protein